MTDLFDEFEFKPLTEGLGFHKKKQVLREPGSKAPSLPLAQSALADLDLDESPSRPAASVSASSPLSALSPAAEKKSESKIPGSPAPAKDNIAKDSFAGALDLVPPLPRKEFRAKHEALKPEVEIVAKSITENKKIDFEKTVKRHLQAEIDKRTDNEPVVVNWSIGAAFLDVVMITAFSLLFMIAFLIITKVDLMMNLGTPIEGDVLYFSLAGIFLVVGWVYFLATRLFAGFSLGEWTFDQQMGTPADRAEYKYGLRVLGRTLIGICTGLVVLPILSLILRRDLAGSLSGLHLYGKE
jgi:hypothetical protein